MSKVKKVAKTFFKTQDPLLYHAARKVGVKVEDPFGHLSKVDSTLNPKPPDMPDFPAPSNITGETSSKLKKRVQQFYGRQSTILTGGMGAKAQSSPVKTLLGM